MQLSFYGDNARTREASLAYSSEMARILCCLLLASVSLLRRDVTGKWSGSFDITGPDPRVNATNDLLDLKQTGGDLSGVHCGPERGASVRHHKR